MRARKSAQYLSLNIQHHIYIAYVVSNMLYINMLHAARTRISPIPKLMRARKSAQYLSLNIQHHIYIAYVVSNMLYINMLHAARTRISPIPKSIHTITS